eukprot:TRINITY_DN1107_c0_g1_i1.p1 TRINITY_DN1107_c0_g1~~TRINITY_DN1107_c0_g1_i1.p1  ORF type:complete len:476 (+),score=76.19 TRINITY_DN1107_c0_g1_i1:314-1741(+)
MEMAGSENLDTMFPDTIVNLALFLDVKSLLDLSSVSKTLYVLVSQNTLLWQTMCISTLGCDKPSLDNMTTRIGLANTELTWKEFFVCIYSSDVFTWGLSSSRTGHFDNPVSKILTPQLLEPLHQKCVSFIGKTAEVGSIVKSQNGKIVYFWGHHCGPETCNQINELDVSELSPIPGDFVVHCSCGHHSGFLLVMDSGLVFNKYNLQHDLPWLELSVWFSSLLNEGEKAIVSLGGQRSRSAIITNQHNTIIWPRILARIDKIKSALHKKGTDVSDISDLLKQDQFPGFSAKKFFEVIPPIDNATNEKLKFVKHRFGHVDFFVIDDKQRLYKDGSVGWDRVEGTENLKIVDVDSGSGHSGFVTEDGDVYTWGTNNHGNLCHNDLISREVPTRVEWVRDNNYKVVAIGCGGYIGWEGGFTLLLLDDNRLFCAGDLGIIEREQLPVQVGTEEFYGRHILSISAGEDWAGVVTSMAHVKL